MALSVLNNIPSLVATNNLAVTNNNLQNTLFQLSSGSRINSGADDPAGLSIANGLQANITALNQSAQNATDGIGQLQVADGALSQVTTLLNRAVTLTTEAANGGLTNSQMAAIGNEYNSIMSEISRIGGATNFNGTPVFQSANVNNPNASDSANSVALTTALTNADALTLSVGGNNYTFTPGSAPSSWVQSSNALAGPTTQLTAGNSITLNGTQFSANTIGYTTGAGGLTLGTALSTGNDELQVTYNTHTVTYQETGDSDTLANAVAAINNQGNQYGISATIVGGNLQISGAGTTQGSGNLTVTTNAAMQTDINGGNQLTANQTTTLGELAQQINNSSGTTNLTATINSGILNVTDSAGNVAVTNNSLSSQLGAVNNVSTVSNLISWINNGAGGATTGLSASLASGSTGKLDIVDNLNRNNLSVSDVDTVLGGFAAPTMSGAENDNVFISDGQVSSSYYTVAVPIGPLTTSSIGTNSTTIGTYTNNITNANAPNALTAVNTAISYVAEMRGVIGAGINRLNSATNVINTQVQNLTSAQSSIQDANVGQVVSNLSKYQILEQTGISALAQANQNQQAIVKLLQ
jgi:flagellin